MTIARRQNVIIAGTLLLLMGAVFWLFRLPALMFCLIAMNCATFAAYALDKRAARIPHARRIPEATLHLLAALGGSPAALLAQQWLRHKNRKASFQLVFWSIVAAQLLVVAATWQFLSR